MEKEDPGMKGRRNPKGTADEEEVKGENQGGKQREEKRELGEQKHLSKREEEIKRDMGSKGERNP